MKAQLPLKVEIELKAALSIEASLDGRSLNNYVEMLLNTHPARRGFKDKKPSTERTKKR
jgi:hypothetical protein